MNKNIKAIDTRDMTREEWLKARLIGIGGSDAGAIVGVNAYRSPVSVWADKTGRAEETPDNDSMRIGRDLEDYVARRWCEKTGKKCHRRNAILIDPERPFMIANVDRLVTGEDAGLEIKTASPYAADQWKDDSIPPSYEVQCHHYMAVTGAKRWYIGVLIWPHIETREIERDEDIIQNLIKIEQDFWNDYVVKDEMPPADGSKDCGDFIATLYPEGEAQETPTDLSKFKDSFARIREIDALADRLKQEKEAIKQQIQLEMQDNETGICDGWKVSWKNTKPRETLDTGKLKKEHPKLYGMLFDRYRKTGKSSRRFTIKEMEV
jgi:putative phage-type endonuclease